MNRIDACFKRLREQQRKALVPYFTAGDHIRHHRADDARDGGGGCRHYRTGRAVFRSDGRRPVIQRASERALLHHVSLKRVFEFVRAFRATNSTTPVILMGYLNRWK